MRKIKLKRPAERTMRSKSICTTEPQKPEELVAPDGKGRVQVGHKEWNNMQKSVQKDSWIPKSHLQSCISHQKMESLFFQGTESGKTQGGE